MKQGLRVKSNVKVGGPLLQHNQTVAKQGLRVKSNIKAGPGGGGIYLNHNETTAADNEKADTEALDDLPVPESQQAEIKGGPGTGGIYLNHNETTAEDIEKADTELLEDPLGALQLSSSSRALASFKSVVSKPSVNQPYTSSSIR